MQKQLYKSLSQVAAEEQAERKKIKEAKMLQLSTNKPVKSTHKGHEPLQIKVNTKKGKNKKKKRPSS